jgi:hypothetical protein
MLAVEFENFQENKQVIDALINGSGDSKSPGILPAVFTDWFLFASNCMRIVPLLLFLPMKLIQPAV